MTRHLAQPQPAGQVTVCYDGACELCAEAVSRVRRIYRGRRLRWIPYQSVDSEAPEVAARLDERSLANALHVVEPDGTVTSGAAAVLRIADLVPELGVYRLARLPGVNLVLNPMYALVAHHRHRLSRLLRRGASAGG
jgi:predicted DCC family thiol-disulfide oxidoreductase YuxK